MLQEVLFSCIIEALAGLLELEYIVKYSGESVHCIALHNTLNYLFILACYFFMF